jgi:hypothetical protein
MKYKHSVKLMFQMASLLKYTTKRSLKVFFSQNNIFSIWTSNTLTVRNIYRRRKLRSLLYGCFDMFIRWIKNNNKKKKEEK